MAQPLIMYNLITSSSGNESQARYDLSQPSTPNQLSYGLSNLPAQNQAIYHDSSHLSSRNQARYDSSQMPTQIQIRYDESSRMSAHNQTTGRYDESARLSAQNQARYDPSNLSAQNQTRYNSPHLLTQNEAKSESAGTQAQPHERLFASSPAAQALELYSNQGQGRFDPPTMMGQQQPRFDPTNTLLAQQQAMYYTHLQSGYYGANAQSVFHSPNMLSQYQPGFYYNPLTQQMLLGSNISSGYPYPFQAYNLNSAYGGNPYFNMSNLQPMSVNHPQLPTQQAVRISSPSTTTSSLTSTTNFTSMSTDSQKNAKKKTKQVIRKQKENEPKASKPQPRKKRKKQEPVVQEANEAESASIFPNLLNSSMPVVSSSSADLIQNLQVYKEHLHTSQQDLLRNNNHPHTDASPSKTCNQKGTILPSEPNTDNVQKCNPSFDSEYNSARGQSYRQYDNMDKHLDQSCDLEASEHKDKDNMCNEDARVTNSCFTVGSKWNTSNENMNYSQTSSEKQDKHILSGIVNQDKKQNEKKHYKDLKLQMPVCDGQPSSSNYNPYQNNMQNNVYQTNTYYNHLYKEVVDLSVISSENKSLNTAYETKKDDGLTKSQLFEFSVTSSSERLIDPTHQSWIQDGTKDSYPPRGNENDADDKHIFKAGEDLCQSTERQFTECDNSCDYNMPKDEQILNKKHPVDLLNQMVTGIDEGKTSSTKRELQIKKDDEQFARFAGHQSCVIDGSQDASNTSSTSDYNHPYGISGFDYNVSVPIESIYQNYYNKPMDFTKCDSHGNKNRDVTYQKENSQILNDEAFSTDQNLYINITEFSQNRPQFDSPVEVQVYPEKNIENFRGKQFRDSQIHPHTRSSQQPQDSHFDWMLKDYVVSADKESASFSTSSSNGDIQNNYNMETLNPLSDAITGSENLREESNNDKFQADRLSGKTCSQDDFDSKWEIIYSSQSKENPNSRIIEPKISENSHELNLNQDDSLMDKSKEVAPQLKENQYLYEHIQRCSLPSRTEQDRTPTPSEDFKSKWEIMYSKENVYDKKCANSLEPEYQIMSQSAKHSIEDYKIPTESYIQSIDRCEQNAECIGMTQNASPELKMKEENVEFESTSQKATIGVECKDQGFIADVDRENCTNESSVSLNSSKVKVENTEIIDDNLNHENSADMQSFEVIDKDVDNKDVNSVKLKLFFTRVVRRSTKHTGKQSKAETHTCKSKSKQTQIVSFFKKDTSSQSKSVGNHPFACHKTSEISDKMANAAQICDNFKSEPVVAEISTLGTDLGKPVVSDTQKGIHKLKAKTCEEKQCISKEKIFMSRGKQILLRSQEQSTTSMQFDMPNQALTFKTPAVSIKTAGHHKKMSLGCKRNKRPISANVRSKVLSAVSLKDAPGSKVCPSVIVSEIKYLSPLNREFSFNPEAVSRYLVIKVEDMTRMYKPVVSQMMITAGTSTSARQEASVYQYTGTSSSYLRATTVMGNNKGGNSCSEKNSVMVPALAKKVCDICGWCYSCTMIQHINSDKHQSCINNPGFYSGLDELISSIGCIDKLIISLNTHNISTISELLQENSMLSSEPVSKHSKSDELCAAKADSDNQSYCPASQSTKSAFQIDYSAPGVPINEAFRSDNFIDKTLIMQAARLNIIKPFTSSRKRKNLEENTVVFKQRKTSSKQCCTNMSEASFNCVHLSLLFDNINIHSSDKNFSDTTNPDNLKDNLIHHIDQIKPDINSKSVNRPKRQVKLPRFIKVKKPKSNAVTFCVPSPKKVKVFSLAACENLFQQCIDELKGGSSTANSKKVFSFY